MSQRSNHKPLFTAALLLVSVASVADDLKGRVVDAANSDAVPYAVVTLTDTQGQKHSTVSDLSGGFHFQDIAPGKYTISVTYLGYHDFTMDCTCPCSAVEGMVLRMKQDQRVLNEVVVTAHES